MTNTEVVQEIYAAFSRGDMAHGLDLMADDVVWDFPASPAPYSGRRSGREGVREFFEVLIKAIEIEQFDIREIMAQGDKVAVFGEERSRVRATGRHFEQRWAHVYALRDGKVAEVRLYEDTAAQAAAFGESPAERAALTGPMGVTEPPFSGGSGPGSGLKPGV